jgi:hypothetical protein
VEGAILREGGGGREKGERRKGERRGYEDSEKNKIMGLLSA